MFSRFAAHVSSSRQASSAIVEEEAQQSSLGPNGTPEMAWAICSNGKVRIENCKITDCDGGIKATDATIGIRNTTISRTILPILSKNSHIEADCVDIS